MPRCEDCFAGNKKGKCNALTENLMKKKVTSSNITSTMT